MLRAAQVDLPIVLHCSQLVEELREEQGKAAHAETEKKEVEARVRELQTQAEEEEAAVAKWGDRMVG